jgi:DNA-binding CsgD family transcriptional regulator
MVKHATPKSRKKKKDQQPYLEIWTKEMEKLLATNVVDKEVFGSVVEKHLLRCYSIDQNLHTSSMFFLFNNTTTNYVFVSKTVEDVLGYTSDEVVGNGFEWIFTLMTPAELEYKGKVMADIYTFISSLAPDQVQRLVVRYDMVGMTKSGQVKHCLEELMFPVVGENSMPLLTTCFIHELDAYARPDERICTIFDQKSGGASNPLFRKVYNVKKESVLSDRELEVLSCFAKGLSTIEVSAQLHISSNTIKSHRKNILTKIGAKNTAEAVRVAHVNRMI